MTSMHTTFRRGALAGAAALAIAAPAALAAGAQPPSAHVVETGVPAGQTEHGIFTSTNVNDPHWKYYRHIEYWATTDRWMATATDRAGHLIDQQLGGPEGWTIYTGATRRRGQDGTILIPNVQTARGHQLPPFPGYGAPGNQEAIANGWFLPLANRPAQTIAGFTGTVYQQDPRRSRPGEIDEVVLQDGTLQPLLRETKVAHPGGGGRPIDFQDRLVSREELPSASARVQLTHETYTSTVRGWRAKVRAFKARVAKAKKARTHRAKPKATVHRTHATKPKATPVKPTTPSSY
ncbi:MAG: hypothetical protein QOE11_1168 [Solirubrobacteraceae bacterium]|nr:hypothetical protein [Solirubrobacteraceae bacterium]